MVHVRRARRTRRLALALLWGVALPFGRPDGARAEAPAPAGPVHSYEALFDALARLEPDSTRQAHVASLMLRRDAGVFVLEEGTVTLCRPIGGRVCAALFTGRGAFSLTPPNDAERGQLERFTGRRAMRREFTELGLVFADSTLDELEAALSFGPGQITPSMRRIATATGEYLVARHPARRIHYAIARTLLDGARNGLFYAHVGAGKEDPVFFAIDPFAREKAMFMRRPADDAWFGLVPMRGQEIVSQFALEGDAADAPWDLRPAADAERYALDVSIDGNLRLTGRLDLTLRAIDPVQRWIAFGILPGVVVDSVWWDEGGPARRFKEREGGQLWAECVPPLEGGSARTVHVTYHGDVMHRAGDWVFLESSTGWYPHLAGDDRAAYDLTFHYPSAFQLVSVGRRASLETRGATATAHWVEDRPLRYAMFNLGFYKAWNIEDAALPPITVFTESRDRSGTAERLDRAAMSTARQTDRQVAADVANCVLFFGQRFGAPGCGNMQAVQTPGNSFETLPGLVQLPLAIVSDRAHRREADPALFRAHEISHEWWGVGVEPRTYHDRWLAEGFAEYSAIWYLRDALLDARGVDALLDAWRRELVENRRYVLGRGQRASPIWMGYRANSSSTGGDYDLIVYEKSAWVLHMLRGLLADSVGDGGARFDALMADFYRDHRGGTASTEEFVAAASAHAGADLGWFFRQWVYGTDIPSYTFAHLVRHTPNGARVSVRVEQSNVSDGFHMPVPIRIEFADGRSVVERIDVTGAVSELELAVPETPKRVVFNDGGAVLCDTRIAKWK